MLSTTNDPLKDKELSGKLKCHERDITKLLRKGKDVLFRLSHELFLARNTCLEHNSETAFGQWVEGLGISRSGAYRSIARWEVLAPKILGHPASGVGCHAAGSQPSFEGFLCFAKFDDSALDVLAKHSTPPKAINAAVKTAQAGKGMTKKEAVALVEKHTKPKPEPVDEPDDVGCIPAMAMDPATVLQDPIDVDSQPATPAEVQEAVAQAAADDAAEEYDNADADSEKPSKAATQPPRKLDKAAYYKQWETLIGPMVRLVDKIGNGVGEKGGGNHSMVMRQLDSATEAMAKWMGVEI